MMAVVAKRTSERFKTLDDVATLAHDEFSVVFKDRWLADTPRSYIRAHTPPPQQQQQQQQPQQH